MNKKSLIVGLALTFVLATTFFLTREKTTTSLDSMVAPAHASDLYEDGNILKVNSGTATVKRASGEEEEVSSETNVEIGDTIVVEEGGKATLYWFDHSVSRLAAGTELKIDESSFNPENINETNVGFEVVSGSVWSKVQSLIDKDSEFVAHAGNVVAGVRGSVFNMTVKGDEVQVASIAHAMFIGDKTIVAGETMTSKKDSPADYVVTKTKESEYETDWYKDNIEEDKNDANRMMEASLNRLKSSLGAKADMNYNTILENFNRELETIEDPVEREVLRVKVIGVVRSLDVMPDDNVYDVKIELYEKLIEWSDEGEDKEYYRTKLIEQELYVLSDWVDSGEADPEELDRFIDNFEPIAEKDHEFFVTNPELAKMADNIVLEVDGEVETEVKPVLVTEPTPVIEVIKEPVYVQPVYETIETEPEVIIEPVIVTDGPTVIEPEPVVEIIEEPILAQPVYETIETEPEPVVEPEPELVIEPIYLEPVTPVYEVEPIITQPILTTPIYFVPSTIQ